MNFDRNRVGMMRRQYPVGTRIQLDSLCTNEQDDAFNIALRANCGLCGTVIGVDDQPSLLMKWDNGRSLSLLPFEDSFTVIHKVQRGTLYDEQVQALLELPDVQWTFGIGLIEDELDRDEELLRN